MGFTEQQLRTARRGFKFGKDAWGRGESCSRPAVSYLRLGLDGNAAHFALIEYVLADRPGDWRVSIVGSQANDRWEMKIFGPNAF